MEDAARLEENRRITTTLGRVGLAIAAVCYVLGLVILLTFHRQNSEDGMVLGFAMLGQVPLWLGLLAFLWPIVTRPSLSRPAIVAVGLIFPLAAYASFWSFELIGQAGGWLYLVPILLPPLTALFGALAIPAAGKHRRDLAVLGFGAAALALLAIFADEYEAGEARKAQGRTETAAELARYEADFQSDLHTQTRIDSLLAHLREEPDHQTRALAAIRRLPSRQADAVRLLESDRPLVDLDRLFDFDLAVTPELCRAFRARWDRLAETAQPGEAEMQAQNVAWLAKNGCDLSAP